MRTIRQIFDAAKPIDRRIEKVITYDTTNEELLKHEVQEYVATESIETHFDRLLDQFEYGMSGGANAETGVWVSGFYGSGKSSFTKYLGFALDPSKSIDDKPFLHYLQHQFKSKALRARLATMAQRFPSVVIMLDLASEQLSGATMAEISSVLYLKVMHWAGYSRDEKIAYLEFMLERDGKMDEFESRIASMANGKQWAEIKNQPLAVKALASKLAAEFYPEWFPDSKAFNDIKIEERIPENERVKQMLGLIRKRTQLENVIFILDEVGQYVAARDDLILNLDGLAKNINKIGHGHAWIIATAQQTLTEDDPRAATNTAKLFKLKDRFPLSIDLEASDIKEICYTRLLNKSVEGEKVLVELYDKYGPQLRYATQLANTKYYKFDLDKASFCKYYPFLPVHFDILLQLLSRLAKTRGGIGLRSAIKVLQDVLVDASRMRSGAELLADQPLGQLANTAIFYDTLQRDIDKPFPHIVNGVNRAIKVFGPDSIHVQAAKSIAVLQILEDFPVSRENVAALLHPSVDSPSLTKEVDAAIDELLREQSVPLNEPDNTLRFMSEAVIDMEKERQKIIPRTADSRQIQNRILRELFNPLPSVRLYNTRSVSTGLRFKHGSLAIPLAGEKEVIQTWVDLIPEKEYDAKLKERITESQQRAHENVIFFNGHQDDEIESLCIEVFRCHEIYNQHRNKAGDKDVQEYLRGQNQLAGRLEKEIESRLKKALIAGSFVFRGKPRAVGTGDADVIESLRAFLSSAATEVFHKYGQAPVNAESATAERFLKTERLDRIASKDDPLNLVTAQTQGDVIDKDNKAIISIRDYLEERGQVDGRKLLDDFFDAPYGWSKDTTRYITAAMLVAGIIKLRISGEDITVRGETAIEHMKNTAAFNKIGIALRNEQMNPSLLQRARERLLDLTGTEPLPLEEEISKCVIRHFPDLQQAYAPLQIQLKTLNLEGEERAQNIIDNLAEILKGDASDATSRLGPQECPFYDDLCWARAVKKAFDNGIDTIIRQALTVQQAIIDLPDSGVLADLITNTRSVREQLQGYITRADFYAFMPQIQQQISELEGEIKQTVTQLNQKLADHLKDQTKRLQHLPQWADLSQEGKARLVQELESLDIEARPDLQGLQTLIKNRFTVSEKITALEREIGRLAESKEVTEDESEIKKVSVRLPRSLSSIDELLELIETLNGFKQDLENGQTIRIQWQ